MKNTGIKVLMVAVAMGLLAACSSTGGGNSSQMYGNISGGIGYTSK